MKLQVGDNLHCGPRDKCFKKWPESSWCCLFSSCLYPDHSWCGPGKTFWGVPPEDKGHPKAGNPYSTTEAGLAAAGTGDTVEIYPGAYSHDVEAPCVEDVVIDTPGVRLHY